MYYYNQQVGKHTYVCSLHFKEEDMEYHQFSGRRTIKLGAVPCIFKCWEGIPHLTTTPKRSRPLNSLQLARSLGTIKLPRLSDEDQKTGCKIREMDNAEPTAFEKLTTKNESLNKENEGLKKIIEELSEKNLRLLFATLSF